MIDGQAFLTPKLPWGVRIEMLTARDAILQQMQNVVMACGVPGGESRLSDKSGTFEPGGDLVHWFTDLKKKHMDGEVMVVVVRTRGTLVGFLVLEPAQLSVSYTWIAERFRGMGLGQRFYSSACTNLSTPRPQFVLHKDLKEEFAPVLKDLAEHPLSTIRFTY